MAEIINQTSRSFSAPVEERPLARNLSFTGKSLLVEEANKYINGMYGCVFDGKAVWGSRSDAKGPAYLTKIDVKTGESSFYPLENGVNGNSGLSHSLISQHGVFDGTNIWFLPSDANSLTKVDPETGTMTGYSTANGVNGNVNLKSVYALGGVFDGANIWYLNQSNQLVQLDPKNGRLTGHDILGTNSGYYHQFIAFDGAYIWTVPSYLQKTEDNQYSLHRWNPATRTGELISLDDSFPASSYVYALACDGTYLWLTTSTGGGSNVKYYIYRMDTRDHTWSSFARKNNNVLSTAWDGGYVWLVGQSCLERYSQDGECVEYPWSGENIPNTSNKYFFPGTLPLTAWGCGSQRGITTMSP